MGNQGTIPGRLRRGPLIAIVVAFLVVASPLLVVTSARGRAGGTSSSRGGRVTHVAFAAIGLGIVQELGNTALGYGVDQGFGWVLAQFGLGSGVDQQIAEIQSKLEAIEQRLSAIEAATQQLRGELAQGTYSGLAAQTTPIIANVNQGMADLDFIAHMRADDPTKKALTEDTLRFIHEHLLRGKQQELADRITGTAGADGLVLAAYKVAKTHTLLWTRLTSTKVRDVFDYYADAEARLLLLRVEYMHAYPGTYSGHYIETQIKDVQASLNAQRELLKPEPGPREIADTRTNLDWDWDALFSKVTFESAQSYPVANGYRLANSSETLNLIGSHGTSSTGRDDWVQWLNREIGGQLSVPSGFDGVWTSTVRRDFYGVVREAVYVNPNGVQLYTRLPDKYSTARGMFLVRTRPHAYWY